MKIVLALTIAAVVLSGCATNSNQAAIDLLTKITTDPNCAHDDDLTMSAGGLTGPMISGHAGRHCPGPVAAPIVASVNGVTVGTVVAPNPDH